MNVTVEAEASQYELPLYSLNICYPRLHSTLLPCLMSELPSARTRSLMDVLAGIQGALPTPLSLHHQRQSKKRECRMSACDYACLHIPREVWLRISAKYSKYLYFLYALIRVGKLRIHLNTLGKILFRIL